MILIKDNQLLPTEGYSAITIWPFVFVDTDSQKWKDEDRRKELLNHEKIHLEQQKELLVLPFYLLYFLDIFVKLFIYSDYGEAYRNSIFEKEAHEHDKDLEYLEKRKRWNYLIKIIT